MKKILVLLLAFMMILPTQILGESNSITIDGSYVEGTYKDNGYEIYYDGDLTITLEDNITLSGENGIYVTGNLSIVGEYILTIDVTGIGIKVDGDFNVTGSNINIINSSKAYEGNKVLNEAYILDENAKMAYYYYDSPGTYTSYLLDGTPLTKLTISSKKYADIGLLDKSHTTLYKNYDGDIYEYRNVEGFIVNTPSDNLNVTYNESLLTYYVKIWNDFNEEGFSSNFIEFVFGISEWAKTLDYEVIEAKNFYYDIDGLNPYVVSEDRHPMNLVGYDIYSYNNDASSLDAVSTYMLFVAKGADNKIVLKVYGKDDNYRYINLEVNKKEEPAPSPKHEYRIVNTGTIQDFPDANEGDKSINGEYILNDDLEIDSHKYKLTADTVINLNSHSITYNVYNGTALFDLNGHCLTINGDTSSNIIANNDDAVLFNSIKAADSLMLNGGTYSKVSNNTNTSYAINVKKGKLTINDAKIDSNKAQGIYFKGSELNLKNITLDVYDNGIDINSGTALFENIDIKSTNNKSFTKAETATLSIKPGTYSFDPTGYYDDINYVCGQNTADGKYIVGYKVNFDFDNGEESKDVYVLVNSKINKPVDPIKEGYNFKYWKYNDSEFGFDTNINENLELKAYYEEEIKPVPPKEKGSNNYFQIVNTGVRQY